VPIEGVLNWGDEVMKACQECLLMEHGFDYDDYELMSGELLRKQKKKKSKTAAAGGGDDDDEEGGQIEADGAGKSDASVFKGFDGVEPKSPLSAHRELDFSANGGAGGDDDDAPRPHRLQRRRSSNQMLVPHHEGDAVEDFDHTGNDTSPSKHLRLPEVAVQQARSASHRHASFSKTTLGGRKLISHHSDAAGVFDTSDVEDTTNWLLSTLAERYQSATDGEKREVEMLVELARAAGHSVEGVGGVLTRDAFVKFLAEHHASEEEEFNHSDAKRMQHDVVKPRPL
jgi:hypothetical protein